MAQWTVLNALFRSFNDGCILSALSITLLLFVSACVCVRIVFVISVEIFSLQVSVVAGFFFVIEIMPQMQHSSFTQCVCVSRVCVIVSQYEFRVEA